MSFYGQASYGQASNPESQSAGNAQRPSVKVNTRLVIVDIVAHDKKGNVVTDLKDSDIRILEDGKEQPIGSFAFQQAEPAAPPQQQQLENVAERQPANVFSNARKFSPDRALNVILLDSLNSNLLNQAYVRIEMIKFLEKLPQGQPVAIFALGSNLRLIQDFTTDPSELKRVAATFKGHAPTLAQNPTGTSEVTMIPTGASAEVLAIMSPQMLSRIQNFTEETTADQSDIRIQQTFAALTTLGHVLSKYKGRKNLIWISESIPMNIFAEVDIPKRESPNGGPSIPGETQSASYKTIRTYGDRLAELANLLTDAEIAVYPIDARGLVGNPFYNVANQIGGADAMGGLAMKAEGKLSKELFEAHSTMLDIADRTGGKAYYNRNDIDNALSDGIKDGTTYYTVGYYPQNKNWNGRFRKIEVKSRRAGLKLRYRTGYFAIDREAYPARYPDEKNAEINQALTVDTPAATALQFTTEINPSSSDPTTLVLRYAIDPQTILFTPDSDGLQHAQLGCAVRAFTPGHLDKPVKTEANLVNAALEPDVFNRIKSTYFPCETKINLAPGQYILRLAVRDNNGKTVGSANAHVSVTEHPTTMLCKTDLSH